MPVPECPEETDTPNVQLSLPSNSQYLRLDEAGVKTNVVGHFDRPLEVNEVTLSYKLQVILSFRFVSDDPITIDFSIKSGSVPC